MSDESQEILVKSRVGRVILHIVTLFRDRKYFWHLKGITREFLF
jgi:hypothetical protein